MECAVHRAELFPAEAEAEAEATNKNVTRVAVCVIATVFAGAVCALLTLGFRW
jgi:hypothetical protein